MTIRQRTLAVSLPPSRPDNDAASEVSSILESHISGTAVRGNVEETGRILSVGDGIGHFWGLQSVQAKEMAEFSFGVRGMCLNLEADNVGASIFDAIGNPIDGKGPIQAAERYHAFLKAPGIPPRRSVNQPMMTGLKPIDAMVPIGQGKDEVKNSILSVTVGQKCSTAAQLVKTLKHPIIAATLASEAAPLQCLAPFSSCTKTPVLRL
ncbi:hypothetical protein L210DRAFT_3615019 [Boletus edulis BED1]|uniref:ATPase F1/V1/A1 complex alpha/beta subunit N-terminal domain-containing protein n=1 Tax=Boletus edulis BED1 TaxID=1328754 RepID=A0AAD4BFP9_BOLED|nr:hypothetical protein L210DRAFT_3615019 [Boletus edulis BED1]